MQNHPNIFFIIRTFSLLNMPAPRYCPELGMCFLFYHKCIQNGLNHIDRISTLIISACVKCFERSIPLQKMAFHPVFEEMPSKAIPI